MSADGHERSASAERSANGVSSDDVRRGDTPEVLASIEHPGVQLAVWQRPAAGAASASLQREHGRLRTCRFGLAIEPDWERAAALRAALAPLAPASALRAAILEVIAAYVALARSRACEEIPLRIEAIEERVCRRFHVDHVGLRLLCTLYGAGTEWLPEQAAVREALGRGGGEVIRDASAIQTIASGDVVALKGHCHRRDPGGGAIHRSPDASPAAPRLLVATDLPG